MEKPRKKPSHRSARALENPGDTYFHAFGTIIGSESLTTVFEMGTGVAFPIWSPGKDTFGGKAERASGCSGDDFAFLQLVVAVPWQRESPANIVPRALNISGQAFVH